MGWDKYDLSTVREIKAEEIVRRLNKGEVLVEYLTGAKWHYDPAKNTYFDDGLTTDYLPTKLKVTDFKNPRKLLVDNPDCFVLTDGGYQYGFCSKRMFVVSALFEANVGVEDGVPLGGTGAFSDDFFNCLWEIGKAEME